MQNAGQLIGESVDAIIEQWISAVCEDREIAHAKELPSLAIRDHVPAVLKAIAQRLAHQGDEAQPQIEQASLTHGALRAEQGFDPSEVMREYRLLRRTIFSTLRPKLLETTASAVLETTTVVNEVIDQALTLCFESYMEERLEELARLREQVTLASEEMTRLARSSQEQIAVLAHEIKTPLNSIVGYAELFLRQQQRQLREEVNLSNTDSIERVLRNGRRLLQTVNRVLDLARHEYGEVQLQTQTIEVATLLQSVSEVIEPLAQAKDLLFTVNAEQAPQQVTMDLSHLQQVLINLCSNAIRYTNQGSVQLKCIALSPQQWQIQVIDTGVGISPENQTHIFKPYFQANEAGIFQRQGTGLGLAIVAQTVRLLQGDIQLTSQVGEGSIFTVTLPQTLQPTTLE